MKKIEELKNKIEELKTQTKEVCEEYFAEFAKEFFVNYNDIKSFSWTQYIPYFNDGDTCTFKIGNIYITTDKDETFSLWEGSENEYADEVISYIEEELNDMLRFLETTYGEHAEIEIKKSGEITINSFEDHE